MGAADSSAPAPTSGTTPAAPTPDSASLTRKRPADSDPEQLDLPITSPTTAELVQPAVLAGTEQASAEPLPGSSRRRSASAKGGALCSCTHVHVVSVSVQFSA